MAARSVSVRLRFRLSSFLLSSARFGGFVADLDHGWASLLPSWASLLPFVAVLPDHGWASVGCSPPLAERRPALGSPSGARLFSSVEHRAWALAECRALRSRVFLVSAISNERQMPHFLGATSIILGRGCGRPVKCRLNRDIHARLSVPLIPLI